MLAATRPTFEANGENGFVHQVKDFLEGLGNGKPAGPTFCDVLETQKVCDAVLDSAKSGAWKKV